MKQRWITAAAVAATILVSACSGGSGGSSALPKVSAPTNPQLSATATFTVSIPHDTAQSAARHAKYLTPAVKGIDFQVQQDLSAAGSVQAAPNDRGYVFYALSPQATYCVNGTTALTCTLAVNAYPGADLITVTTYDGTNPSTPGTNNGSSHMISTGYVTANIVPGIDNPINITTQGIVNALTAGLDTPAPPLGTAFTQPLRVLALDPSDYIIIGNYDMPLSVASSDTTGAITVSSGTITGSSAMPNVVYNGASVAATLTVKTTSPYTTYSTGYSWKQTFQQLLPGQKRYAPSPATVQFTHANSPAQTIPVTAENGAAPLSAVSVTATDSLQNPACNGIVTASLSGSSVVITPVKAGVCGLVLTGTSSAGTIPIVVSP